jgi:hypothetical protein
MLRFAFFILLIANIAFGVHIYLTETRPANELPREVNREQIKIVGVMDAARAQKDAEANRKLIASLNGSACVDFSTKPADAARAQGLFAEMKLGDRLSTRNVEEFTRFGIAIGGLKDRRSADALLANLKKAGVKDVSILADNSISLGVFSSEEAAKRYQGELENKAATWVKGATITPRNSQIRETVFTVREPDTNTVARLTILQREFEGSNLKAVECPGALPAAVVTLPPPDKAPPQAPAAPPVSTVAKK